MVNVYNDSAHLETSIFASYYRQQRMLLIYIWRQIQPEMQDLAVNEVYSLPVPVASVTITVTLSTHSKNKQTIIDTVNSPQLCSTRRSTRHTI